MSFPKKGKTKYIIKKEMNTKNAIKIMLGLLLLVIGFHFCILAKIIPYNIAWGGRLTTDIEMYAFETISIIINLFLILILSIKANFVKPILTKSTINSLLWCFLILFLLNTIGNIFAKTNFEKFFAIVTFVFAFIIGIILRKK